MPELPEVEALALDLGRRLDGCAIARVDLAAFGALKTYDPPLTALHGTLVEQVTRRGKFLDITAGGLHLVLHLARAGWVRWRDDVPATPPRPGGRSTVAARIVLDHPADEHDQAALDITEAGTKKSLAISVVREPSEVPGIARLGPDPLGEEFTLAAFREILSAAGRSQLKGVLRHQGTIAGIGNAYSDEILHGARMSPFTPASSLDEAATERLYAAVQQVLGDAVDRARGHEASELKREKKDHLAVHGRTGEPCGVCGDTIREVSFADSSLQYCPTCQTGGKPLADRRTSKFLK